MVGTCLQASLADVAEELPAPIRVPLWWHVDDPDEMPRPLLWLLDRLACYVAEVLRRQPALGLEWYRGRRRARYDDNSRNRPVCASARRQHQPDRGLAHDG